MRLSVCIKFLLVGILILRDSKFGEIEIGNSVDLRGRVGGTC